MPNGEYDNDRMRLRLEAREGNVGRADRGEAVLTGSAEGNPHDSGFHGGLCKCHHADNPDVRFSFYVSGVADSC
jgi:hypothetical protein